MLITKKSALIQIETKFLSGSRNPLGYCGVMEMKIKEATIQTKANFIHFLKILSPTINKIRDKINEENDKNIIESVNELCLKRKFPLKYFSVDK